MQSVAGIQPHPEARGMDRVIIRRVNMHTRSDCFPVLRASSGAPQHSPSYQCVHSFGTAPCCVYADVRSMMTSLHHCQAPAADEAGLCVGCVRHTAWHA